MATHKYSTDPDTIKNLFIHLTNSSIQKDSDRTASTLQEHSSEVGGTKTSLTYLWQRMRAEGVDTDVSDAE